MKTGKVCAVIGGQWGSEGKGVIVNHLAQEYDIHVRTGSPNAGHSFKYGGPFEASERTAEIGPDGYTFKMQVVPCGWTNPDADLIIGRGAVFNPEILAREIKEIREVTGMDITRRLFIDELAGVLHPKFAEMEGHTEGELHARIGSTGEGVGAARMARMSRVQGAFELAKDYTGPEAYVVRVLCQNVDTVAMLHNRSRVGHKIMLEGTQGSGLSLIHGTWPFVTSADTNVGQLLTDCGMPPSALTDCVMVVRSYPIRVAGNSGPMGEEIDWNTVSERAGFHIEERTTVTQKVRRVAEWSWGVVDQAVKLNGPTAIAFTFADYVHGPAAGLTHWESLGPIVQAHVKDLEARYGVPVHFIGTGGRVWSVVDRR